MEEKCQWDKYYSKKQGFSTLIHSFSSIFSVFFLWKQQFKSVMVLVLLVGCFHNSSLVVQMVKNLPEMQETWVWSLGWEDPLEKGMATHSSILAWRIPWTKEPGGLQSMGVTKSWTWLSEQYFLSTTLNNMETFIHKYLNLRQCLLTSAHEHWGVGSLTKILSLTLFPLPPIFSITLSSDQGSTFHSF